MLFYKRDFSFLVYICVRNYMLGFFNKYSSGNLVFAFATHQRDWMMYLAPVVNIVHGGINIATTSMISKIVPKDEIGRINSWVGTLESLSRLSADPLYAAIFKWTLTFFTGTFFLVTVGLTIPSLVIYL